MPQPIRILLVEDEVLIALCLETELRQAGYHICSRVGTGEEAIVAAERDRPDLILMDIRLAGNLDGIDTARHIKKHSAIPVIFMTGYQDSAIKERAEQLHPLGFFTKPLRIQDIQRIASSLHL